MRAARIRGEDGEGEDEGEGEGDKGELGEQGRQGRHGRGCGDDDDEGRRRGRRRGRRGRRRRRREEERRPKSLGDGGVATLSRFWGASFFPGAAAGAGDKETVASLPACRPPTVPRITTTHIRNSFLAPSRPRPYGNKNNVCYYLLQFYYYNYHYCYHYYYSITITVTNYFYALGPSRECSTIRFHISIHHFDFQATVASLFFLPFPFLFPLATPLLSSLVPLSATTPLAPAPMAPMARHHGPFRSARSVPPPCLTRVPVQPPERKPYSVDGTRQPGIRSLHLIWHSHDAVLTTNVHVSSTMKHTVSIPTISQISHHLIPSTDPQRLVAYIDVPTIASTNLRACPESVPRI